MPADTPFRLTGGLLAGTKIRTQATDRGGLSELLVKALPVAVDQPQAPPVITRAGKEVPRAQIDPRRFEGIFIPPKPLDEPRIVAQTPVPGTPLPRGSQVDLVVTSAREIPFDVFVEPHKSFLGKNIGAFETVLDDDATRNVLLSHENSATLTAPERERLIGTLRQQNIALDENDPQSSFERAFQTLRGAAAFR